jgi:hypothetical protein
MTSHLSFLGSARAIDIWQLMRKCPYIVGGLRQAGFGGGWL